MDSPAGAGASRIRVAPAAAALVLAACGRSGTDPTAGQPVATSRAGGTVAADTAAVATDTADTADRATGAPPADDGEPRQQHFDTLEELLSLIGVAPLKPRRGVDADELLPKLVGPGTPARGNQGNPELARHDVSRARCLAGMEGIAIQTDEQRNACGGHDNMVPIYREGDRTRVKVCIDVFEYPNRVCELPFVWVPPIAAARLCEVAGKRLCTQQEWVLACSGDPEGGRPWKHAYGDVLDLEICNTSKSAKRHRCDPGSAKSAWKTCATNTEPSGAFPRCRSRFGVFDMHGNVAEEMTRLDADGRVYSQLKGSAFFYVDVARLPGERATKENYPDACTHDPRWHVERIDDAWHVNYHLGFRCCLSR